ncbi:hypothetical protein HA402_008166 [Bradysia odoriphaga]|nr:hypothetical protein HA402_008166 [Bradysia odoriphaga]
MNFSLGSNDEVAKINMFMFLSRMELEKLLVMITKSKITYARITMLNILKTMLKYSREKNIPCEIDWTLVFVYTLYWHNDALELLFLETQGTEQDEEIKSGNLVERVIQVFLRQNDEIYKFPAQQQLLEQQRAERLTNLIKDHIDFVTCKTLFSLLRKHVADSPATCNVIILFIDNAAKTLAGQPRFREAYINLMKTVFRHISYVKSYPELLCRLINIFDLSSAKKDEVFRKQILLIVPEAFHRCSLYGTAVDLLTVLKTVGYDHDKLMDLFEKLLSDETSGNRRMETLTLILAADDVFNVFKILNPHDRRKLFDYFKRRFESASDDVEVLYASLMIHMLAALQSTPDRFPGEATNTVENEAIQVFRFLSQGIDAAELKSFAAVHLGMAICVYNSTFRPPGVMELFKSLKTLAEISVGFRFSYELDAKKDAIQNDLRLLTTFWGNAMVVYKQSDPSDLLLPTVIFEFYPRIEINTVASAEEFLSTILECGGAADRFGLFVRTIHYLVNDLKKKKVNPTVNKLFKFIQKTERASDATKIASMIFVSNLQFYLQNFPRPKVVLDVQLNLYKNLIKKDDDNPDYQKEV